VSLLTRTIVFLPLVFCVCACASFPAPPKTYAVTGRVVYADGTPVRAGLVSFHPQGAGVECDAELDKDGRFTLKSYGEQPGTVPGKYKVSINPTWPTRQPADAKSESLRRVAKKYWSAGTTDLLVEVKDQDNHFDLKLRSH
jgi:hypothetical protein